MRFLGSLTVFLAVICLTSVSFAQSESKPAKAPATTKPAETTGRVYVMMTTSKGDILLELNAAKAPKSVANFLAYADRGYYDRTVFHRVIDGFMIQGGGFDLDLQKKETDPPIANEWKNGLKNKKGTIALARTANPNSATSQFFINIKDNTNLDQPISGGAGYAVFGKVIDGMEVVDAIRKTPTSARGRFRSDVPVEDIVIERVIRVAPGDAKSRMKESAGDDATTQPSSPKSKGRTKK